MARQLWMHDGRKRILSRWGAGEFQKDFLFSFNVLSMIFVYNTFIFNRACLQVPPNPEKPCELCYCIRNRTACIMQECTLHVEGCRPVYHEGVCCPIRYDCGKFVVVL